MKILFQQLKTGLLISADEESKTLSAIIENIVNNATLLSEEFEIPTKLNKSNKWIEITINDGEELNNFFEHLTF